MGDHPLFLSVKLSSADAGAPSPIAATTPHRRFGILKPIMIIERDERPWGMYEVLVSGDQYKVKRIVVNPGHRLSLQMHRNRSEHWVVVQGSATVTVGDEVLNLEADQTVNIPTETKHRIANPGKSPLVFIEVQCGSYLGEDDITRFEDDYKRE